jgi:hypothetical protein
MVYTDHDSRCRSVPVHTERSIKPRRRWMNQVVAQCSWWSKPQWVHLPDRVWRRNSALLISIHERKHLDD